MLRYGRRWHDAANNPLHGEARLLWFAAAAAPAPAGGTPDPADDEEGADVDETAEAAAPAAPEAPEDRNDPVDVQREVTRRRSMNVLTKDVPVSGEKLSARNIANDAQALRQRLESSVGLLEQLKESAEDSKNKTELQREIAELQITIGALKKRMTDAVFPLVGDDDKERGLHLDAWEEGTMTPAEFLRRYTAYMGDNGTMDTIDAADRSLTPERRKERKDARMQLLADTIAAVEKAKRTLPKNLSQHVIENNVTPAVFEEELWMSIYEKEEKDQIIKAISEAAGVTVLKEIVADDVDSIDVRLDDHDFDGIIKKLQRSILEETRKNAPGGMSEDGWEGGGYIDPRNIFATITSTGHAINQTLGLEWMTAYEWIEALNEVWEGMKELRKQKSRLRVSRAASTIGKALSMIPGMGGDALVTLLEQQQEAKNEEIKDGYLNELKNNRVDPGFKDLFGDGQGKQGLLAYYRQIGDTNRTRAILEFAAGKGLLYGIGRSKDTEYMLPGNIPFKDLMPSEWTDAQIGNWFGNLQFTNKSGEDAQIKAGETLMSGKGKFEDYTDTFKGAVESLSLWFAKGVANKALEKVKNGEMSATLTLIVVNQWETDPIFRKHLDHDWLDRLAGDHKQMLIGMMKYDKGHLLKGAEVGEYDITKADAKFDSENPDERGQQRLGPLVGAVRSYLLKLDKTLQYDDDKTKKRFFKLQAKLLACQRIGPKDGLPKGTYGSFYSDDLMPYHIEYEPDEMRDAEVGKIGVDHFIEESEIINVSAEVMQYIGNVDQNGFAEPTKARYFFTRIIDAYEEIDELANTPGPQQSEFQRAKENYLLKQRENLNLWIERAFTKNGAKALLTERHARDKRLLVLTLVQNKLISSDVIEKLAAEGNRYAQTLTKQMRDSGVVSRGGQSGAGASGTAYTIGA